LKAKKGSVNLRNGNHVWALNNAPKKVGWNPATPRSGEQQTGGIAPACLSFLPVSLTLSTTKTDNQSALMVRNFFSGKAAQPTTHRGVDHGVWGSATASKGRVGSTLPCSPHDARLLNCALLAACFGCRNADYRFGKQWKDVHLSVTASNGTGVPLLPLLVRVNPKTLSTKAFLLSSLSRLRRLL